MSYSVKYKEHAQAFWKSLNNVKGDGFVTIDGQTISRWFITEDEERVEIPITFLFCFTKDRYITLLKNAEQQVAQKIPTNSKLQN